MIAMKANDDLDKWLEQRLFGDPRIQRLFSCIDQLDYLHLEVAKLGGLLEEFGKTKVSATCLETQLNHRSRELRKQNTIADRNIYWMDKSVKKLQSQVNILENSTISKEYIELHFQKRLDELEQMAEQRVQTLPSSIVIEEESRVKDVLPRTTQHQMSSIVIQEESHGEDRREVDEVDIPRQVTVVHQNNKQSSLSPMSYFNTFLQTGHRNMATKGKLERDFFSMMMLSSPCSIVWFFGIFAFLIQTILGVLVISEFFTSMSVKKSGIIPDTSGHNVPFRADLRLRTVQVLVIILSAMTQTDLLIGIRTLLLLPGGGQQHRSMNVWVIQIFIPNMLKITSGILILIATFVIIVLSKDIVDLLKDFSALFVISGIDDLFFCMAENGFFGIKISDKADHVKSVDIEDLHVEKNASKLRITLICIIISMLAGYIYIAAGQETGRYVQLAFESCDMLFDTYDGTTGKLYHSIVRDNICQSPKGEGTNTMSCGWDGGDCSFLNDIFPGCTVSEPKLLGDKICHHGTEIYNSRACGYDLGDCDEYNIEKFNFPACTVDYPELLGDGICHTDDHYTKYNTPECSFDGGDCIFNNTYPGCIVHDMSMVGNKICDIPLFSEQCNFDDGDCDPSSNLIGKKFNGQWKWKGAILGTDGNVYGIPYWGNQILKIDPNTNSTSLVGPHLEGEESWASGVLGKDGLIYCIPYRAKYILKFDPKSENITHIENDIFIGTDYKFIGGVLAKNGDIYFIPSNHKRVVKFNPENNQISEIGDRLKKMENKFEGGVLGNNGNIYAIPSDAKQVLKISTKDDTSTYFGQNFNGEWKWDNGILAKDGNIYGCPATANRILQINVEDETTNLIGPDLGSGIRKWSGFVQGPDDFIYGIPYRTKKILIFHPILQTVTTVTLPINDEFFSGETWYWSSGVLASNNVIYATPKDVEQVLAITLNKTE